MSVPARPWERLEGKIGPRHREAAVSQSTAQQVHDHQESHAAAVWAGGTGDLDDLGLAVIDPLPSWVWHEDMAGFAGAITDERARRRLVPGDPGKGAFRRFKDELCEEHPDLLPAWSAFRDARARRRAVQWLAGNSLVDDGSADSFFAGHPDPAPP